MRKLSAAGREGIRQETAGSVVSDPQRPLQVGASHCSPQRKN